MSFTQTITIETGQADQVKALLEDWHEKQGGIAPGYIGARLLEDRDRANRCVVEVEFSSRQEAEQNNDRPETREWAEQLQKLAEGQPAYGNYEVSFATGHVLQR